MTIRILNFPDGFTSSQVPEQLQGSYVVYDAEEIASGAEISSSLSVGFQRRSIFSDGGAITASITPFGEFSGSDGTVITLVGTSSANTVTIPFNDNDYGAYINGQIVLSLGNSITLQWNESALRWYEISRNN